MIWNRLVENDEESPWAKNASQKLFHLHEELNGASTRINSAFT